VQLARTPLAVLPIEGYPGPFTNRSRPGLTCRMEKTPEALGLGNVYSASTVRTVSQR
jgi:hypothetical protein